MPCSNPDHHHPDEARDDIELEAVIHYLVHAYCAGRDIPETVITVHAHESGTEHDRLFTLHVATGPESAGRLAAHALVSDLTEVTIRQQTGARG